jgi:four helix bundle protein
MSGTFPHQRLRVYQKAAPLYEAARQLVAQVRRQHWHLCDQLLRAVASIALNTAEGGGEFSRRDKARFFRMALRSACEALAAIDLLERSALVDQNAARQLAGDIAEVAAMLTALAKRQ